MKKRDKKLLTEARRNFDSENAVEYERLLSHWTKDRLNIKIIYATTYKSFYAGSNPAGDANNYQRVAAMQPLSFPSL